MRLVSNWRRLGYLGSDYCDNIAAYINVGLMIGSCCLRGAISKAQDAFGIQIQPRTFGKISLNHASLLHSSFNHSPVSECASFSRL